VKLNPKTGMNCLSPDDCTGADDDGPTCEVCYLRKRVTELEREVAFLRFFGNNDCTSMADEEMQRLKDCPEDPNEP